MPRNLMTALPKLTEWERYLLTNVLHTYAKYSWARSNDHPYYYSSSLMLADRAVAIRCVKEHLERCKASLHYPRVMLPFEELLAKLEESQ